MPVEFLSPLSVCCHAGEPFCGAFGKVVGMMSYAVYADFNCPFCYALSERLKEHSNQYEIEWRPIQHVASQITRCSVEDLAVLASEVFTVRHRAPEVPIAMPQLRPSSDDASQAFLALQATDPIAAWRFRHQLYRSLWVEDRDISEPQVLGQIFEESGIDVPSNNAFDGATLARWQQEWETGVFDKRIPAMVSSDGRVLAGLASPGDIQRFLEGRQAEGEPSGVCEFVPRPMVLIVGEPRDIWTQVACLKDGNDVLVAVDAGDAIGQIADGLVPDLLVVPAGFALDALETCAQLRQCPEAFDVPILVLDADSGTDRHLQFLELGASEYLNVTTDYRVFKARALLQIATKTRRDLLQRRGCEDPLTGLPNRRELERVVELEWRRGIRSKLPLSVLLVDIDHFKQFNDTYGHQKGDGCLASVAQTLKAGLRRTTDVAARYGGEEFAVVLMDCEAQRAEAIAESLRHAVETLGTDHAASASGVVTVSVGVGTVVPYAEGSPRGLIDRADRCLYAAKTLGRNRVMSSDHVPTH